MRSHVLGLSAGALVLASACATAPGSLKERPIEPVPPPAPVSVSRTISGSELDSMFAQAVADREGPRVGIHAQVFQTAGSRRLRASFDVEDDAYVLIGHLDADGILRIVFPADPGDDGFVRGGGRQYTTHEFFAGFEDQYRFRYNTYGRLAQYQPEAYDGTGGYLFIVASWRPMHFEQFRGADGWDSFELIDAQYRDPRPAIQEFAALVAGVNREAYTVKFARYSSSMNLTPLNGYGSSSFGLGLCSSSYLGWGSQMSWQMMSLASPFMFSGGSTMFYYRGRPYYYDSFLGCASPMPYGFYGGGIAQGPNGPQGPGNPTTGRTHALAFEDVARNPLDPRPTGGRLSPRGPETPADMPVRISPQYRERGLLTPEDAGPRNPARGPRVGIDNGTRPTIQQMVERRGEPAAPRTGLGDDANPGRGQSRSRMRPDDADRNPGTPRTTTTTVRDRGTEQPAPRYSAPDSPRPSPRVESPRVEAPRAEPRPVESRPVASPSASRPDAGSPPPSSGSPASSSSGGKPTPP